MGELWKHNYYLQAKSATDRQRPQYVIRTFVLGEFRVCLSNGQNMSQKNDRPYEECPQDGKYSSHQLQVVV